MKTIIKHNRRHIIYILLFNISIVVSQVTTRRVAVKQATTQKTIKHVASSKNTKGHVTTLTGISTQNVQNKIIFVTHEYGSRGPYVTQPLGVWLNGNKWTIFSQNRSPIKNGSRFNVLVTQKSSNAYVHKTSATNKNGSGTKLNHRSLNNKSNAAFLITQNYGTGGPYNPHHVGVRYAAGFWHIYNLDGKPMPNGAKFNVLIQSSIFKHRIPPTRNHISVINSAKTNGKRKALLFTTFNAQNSVKNYNRAIGVYYTNNKWSIYNENRQQMKGNEAYNLLSVNPYSKSSTPQRAIVTRKPKAAGNGTIRVNTRNTSSTNNTATSPLNNGVIMRNLGIIRTKPFITSTPTSTDRLGPETKSVPMDFSRFIDGGQYTLFKNTFNFFEDIYKDKNPRSNILYYFPANYSIKWDKQSNKYDFNVYYMSAEDRKKGNVLLNVELTSNITTEDINLAEAYLSSRLGKKITLRSIDLRENPKVDFGATLTNFNVKPESVSTSVPTDYQQPIILDWKMESDIDNFVGAMLNNRSGNVMLDFKPYGDSLKVVKVPINLKVNSPITYGKIKFNSISKIREGWMNYLDYPVVPKHFIVLKKKGRRQVLETIDVSRTEIAPGAKYKEIDANVFNKLNQDPVIKIWLAYVLNDECRDCNQTVKRKIIGGTSASEIADIEVQVLNALEYSEANSMKIYIKSVQGDPNNLNEIEFPALDVTEDGITFNEIQLFVPQDKEMSYEYQVTMIMNDGNVLKSKWKNSNSDLLILGESQIKSLFPDKKKDDLINKAKEGALGKVKDSIFGKDASTEDMIDQGLEAIGGIFKKKKDDEKQNKDDETENEEDQ